MYSELKKEICDEVCSLGEKCTEIVLKNTHILLPFHHKSQTKIKSVNMNHQRKKGVQTISTKNPDNLKGFSSLSLLEKKNNGTKQL
jgi:hypothetical protein